MTRRTFWAIFAVLIGAAAGSRAESVRVLSIEKGKAKVCPASGEPCVAAAPRMELAPGDRVETDSRAVVVLQVTESGILQVLPDSQWSAPAGGGISRLSRGTLLAKMKLPPTGNFRVRTPTAIAGVRGTEFAVKVVSAEESAAGVFEEGEVELDSVDPAGNPIGETVTLGPGQESVASLNRPPISPRPLQTLSLYRGKMAALRTRLQDLQKQRRLLLHQKQRELRKALRGRSAP